MCVYVYVCMYVCVCVCVSALPAAHPKASLPCLADIRGACMWEELVIKTFMILFLGSQSNTH
jgi:hypothetical protein